MQLISIKQSSPLILTVLLAALLLSSTVRSDPAPLAISSTAPDLCPSPDPTPDPTGCPINCFRPDPVCGSDGNTYWCGCLDAQCAGVRVVKIGVCDVGNGGPGSGPAGQTLLLVHIIWLIMLCVLVVFGLL